MFKKLPIPTRKDKSEAKNKQHAYLLKHITNGLKPWRKQIPVTLVPVVMWGIFN